MVDKKTARIVNMGLVGEPEHIVFQILETNQIVEFSDIKTRNNNGTVEIITDDLSFAHPYIQEIYWNRGHECELLLNELGEAMIFL